MHNEPDNLLQLHGRRILLGITGGIAAYKAAELVRLLKKAGADVQVVMTLAAAEFVTPTTLQALSGRMVRTELFDAEQESAMGHIDLARWADLILVAPATANFMANLVQGRADNLLATLMLATDRQVILAPAMNRLMWANQATQDNIALLKKRSMLIWGPASGEQACGEVGEGRMLEPQDMMVLLRDYFFAGPLSGVKVTVTAGPTYEPIDPVRFIGNRSSGKMGFALASAFVLAGAEVTLIAGPVSLPTPSGLQRIDVETAEQMQAAVGDTLSACQLFAACAAVADYRPVELAEQKIKKTAHSMSLALQRNPDILSWVAAQDNAPYTLGFAAETHDVEAYARQKLQDKKLNMIAANQVGAAEGGFGSDSNAVQLIWADGSQTLPMMDKVSLAREIVAEVAQQFWHDR